MPKVLPKKNRRLERAKKRLEARRKEYDSMKNTTGFTRPGSMKIR